MVCIYNNTFQLNTISIITYMLVANMYQWVITKTFHVYTVEFQFSFLDEKVIDSVVCNLAVSLTNNTPWLCKKILA